MSAATCYLCHRPHGKGDRECRPYGPGGALLCAGCMFGEGDKEADPAVQAEAERQFAGALARAEQAAGPSEIVVIGDVAGPRPHPTKRGRQ